MRLRRRFAVGVVAVLGAATAVLPALAGSETIPAIEAVNVAEGIYGEHHWSPAQVKVGVGGTVSLSNPSEVKHGVYWVGAPVSPSCTAGVPVGVSAAASGVKWSGTCTFATAGTYTFYCTVHGAAMTARVTVGEAGTSTTTATTPTSPVTSTAPPSTYPPPGEVSTPPSHVPSMSGSPLSGAAPGAVHFAPGLHAGTIKGSIGLSTVAIGGRLEVDLLVRHGSKLVRVGRVLRSHLRAGKLAFVLPLDAGAALTLRSRRRLAVTVRLALVPLHGATLRITRNLVLHP